jgi:hypothetical protein
MKAKRDTKCKAASIFSADEVSGKYCGSQFFKKFQVSKTIPTSTQPWLMSSIQDQKSF